MTESEKTKEIVKRLKAVGINATHDFQDVINHEVVTFSCPEYGPGPHACGVIITFGHVNETWGASVGTNCGGCLGYIETNLIFEESTIEELTYATLSGILKWTEFFGDTTLVDHVMVDEMSEIDISFNKFRKTWRTV